MEGLPKNHMLWDLKQDNLHEVSFVSTIEEWETNNLDKKLLTILHCAIIMIGGCQMDTISLHVSYKCADREYEMVMHTPVNHISNMGLSEAVITQFL